MLINLSDDYFEKGKNNAVVDILDKTDSGIEISETDKLQALSVHLAGFGLWQMFQQNKIHFVHKGISNSYEFIKVKINNKPAIVIIHEGSLELDDNIFVFRPIPINIWNTNTLFIFIDVKCKLDPESASTKIVGWLKNEKPKKGFFGKNFMNREEVANQGSEKKLDVILRSELLDPRDLLRYIRNFHK
jgi:hypothetical protein